VTVKKAIAVVRSPEEQEIGIRDAMLVVVLLGSRLREANGTITTTFVGLSSILTVFCVARRR
jgi:hypothetical protein